MAKVECGKGTTKYGPGVQITLTGDEVATAIDVWLHSQGIIVRGPRTVTDAHGLMRETKVYVDPNGFVIADGEKFSGRGPDNTPAVVGSIPGQGLQSPLTTTMKGNHVGA